MVPEPVSSSDLEWTEYDRGEAVFRRKQLGEAAGGRALGCSLHEIPAGKRAWPFHYHTANEEALYVLSGIGRVRMGSDETVHAVEAGDYLALPTGPEGSHRVSNTGEEPLRYLAVSTMRDPDVLVYPDSGKVGVHAGAPPGGDAEKRHVSAYFPEDAAVDYWTGEEE
ncbi:MAG: cupin domain-containing protein [Salinirussus sp.]